MKQQQVVDIIGKGQRGKTKNARVVNFKMKRYASKIIKFQEPDQGSEIS
jgi:hypothetical protein